MNQTKLVPLERNWMVIVSVVGGFGSGVIGHKAVVMARGSFKHCANCVADAVLFV